MKIPLTSSYRALLLIIGVLLFAQAEAQKFRYSIPGLDSLEESFIVSGASSTILKSGDAELISNNTLTSYWLAFHENGKNTPILDRFRQTQFTSDLFGFYGVSPAGQWDLGLHLRYRRTRIDNAATSSMFKVFEKEETIDPDAPRVLDRSLGGLASIGLRFRIKPIRSNPRLVVNGGYSIKTITGEVKARQLGADRNSADLGVTYYTSISNNVYYFLSGTAQAFFPTQNVNEEYLYNVGASFFLIQRTTNNKLTFYPGLSYSLVFRPSRLTNPENSLIKTAEFLLAYGGLQYAPVSKYNFFLLGGFPLTITVTNPQQEIVRESYSTITLGFRVGI